MAIELSTGWVVQWVGMSGQLYRTMPPLQTRREADELARTLTDECLTGQCPAAAADRTADTQYSVVFLCGTYVECPCDGPH